MLNNKKLFFINFLNCFVVMFIQYLILFFYKVNNIKIFIYLLFIIIVSCIISGFLFSIIKYFLKKIWFDSIIFLILNFLIPFYSIEYLQKIQLYTLEGDVEKSMFFVGLAIVLFGWGIITKLIYFIGYFFLKSLKNEKIVWGNK